jgi:hypothetical protein
LAARQKEQLRPLRAYKNPLFLNSKDARVIRILSEFLEPLSRFNYFGIKDIIVFFGSARIQSPVIARQKLSETVLKLKKEKSLIINNRRNTEKPKQQWKCRRTIAMPLTLLSY